MAREYAATSSGLAANDRTQTRTQDAGRVASEFLETAKIACIIFCAFHSHVLSHDRVHAIELADAPDVSPMAEPQRSIHKVIDEA